MLIRFMYMYYEKNKYENAITDDINKAIVISFKFKVQF